MKEQKTISKLMDNWQSLVGMPKLLNTGSKRCKINIITPKIPYTIDPSMCNWPGANITNARGRISKICNAFSQKPKSSDEYNVIGSWVIDIILKMDVGK